MVSVQLWAAGWLFLVNPGGMGVARFLAPGHRGRKRKRGYGSTFSEDVEMSRTQFFPVCLLGLFLTGMAFSVRCDDSKEKAKKEKEKEEKEQKEKAEKLQKEQAKLAEKQRKEQAEKEEKQRKEQAEKAEKQRKELEEKAKKDREQMVKACPRCSPQTADKKDDSGPHGIEVFTHFWTQTIGKGLRKGAERIDEGLTDGSHKMYDALKGKR
jgi:flagellar biosynthesis GTPase FlhF